MSANRGEWTGLALSVFSNSSVVMIEPQDEMEEGLKALSCRSNLISILRLLWPESNILWEL